MDTTTPYNSNQRDRLENDILALAERILASRVCDGELLTDPAAAGRILTLHLAKHEREVFSVIFLSTRHQILAIEDLFMGTIDGAEVHPREVAKRALHYNAAAVILGHNHPSGVAEPSAADRAVTSQLKQTLAMIDVRLLDHFVVAAGAAPVSLASRGWV